MPPSHIFKIWHAADDAPNAPRHLITLGVGGTDDETCMRRAAELAAAIDAKHSELLWPVDYRVLDVEGRFWSVRIDLVTRPTYVAISSQELPPMPSAVHVFWRGQVACEDARLSSAPSKWPKGQYWMSLLEFADGSHPDGDRCEACWRNAPDLVQRLPGHGGTGTGE